jgi:hypothetical protein
MLNWLRKKERTIFWVLCIGSLIFGIIGVELKSLPVFLVGFGMASLIILIGFIFKIFRKKFEKNG